MNKDVTLQPGCSATYQGAQVIIRKIISLEKIMIEFAAGKLDTVSRLDLMPIRDSKKATKLPDGSVMTYTQAEWDEAYKKYEMIKPAIMDNGNGALVAQIAKDNNIARTTVYRRIEKYLSSGKIDSLIEGRGKANKGAYKIREEVEVIIQDAIQTIYLKPGERKSIGAVIDFIEARCHKLHFEAPHRNTIRNRISEIDEEEVVATRFGEDKREHKYDPNFGKTPDPETILSTVQSDHHLLDIILVDPIYREEIGRPWLTTAIDEKSRMLLGYYLTFDNPSFVSVGMCIKNAVLPKEKLLQSLGIEGTWPCWGFMHTIKVDNGKDFRSESMTRACNTHHINITYRPKRKPRFGGHIESFFKTLTKEVHNLPGTTFSNPKKRDGYESEKKAAMTFKEFEKWLVTFIVNKYHQRAHSSLDCSPIAAWEDGIVGSATTTAVGYQPIPDEERIHIDFLPLLYRTVQDYGVSKEGIEYYSDVLRSWVGRTEKTTGKKREAIKHEFRWDPRDLSRIYFFDRDVDTYYEVPYRDLTHPTLTIWELRAIKKHLKAQGVDRIDEATIFRAVEDMTAIEEAAVAETKKVKNARKKARKENSEAPTRPPLKKGSSGGGMLDDISELQPFSV